MKEDTFSHSAEGLQHLESLAAEVKQGYLKLRGDAAEPPEISVVVPVYAGGESVDNVLGCLASVVHNETVLPTEVIAIVNGSAEQLTQATVLLTKLQEVGIRVVPIAFPTEFKKLEKILGARQAGIDAAQADKVIMVDADSQVSSSWIEAYAQGLENSAFAYGPVQIAKTGDPFHDITAQLSTAAKQVKRAIGIPPMQGGNHGMNKKLLEEKGIDPLHVYAEVRRNEQELAHRYGAAFLKPATIDTPNGYAESGKTGSEFLKMYIRSTLQRNLKMVARKVLKGKQ